MSASAQACSNLSSESIAALSIVPVRPSTINPRYCRPTRRAQPNWQRLLAACRCPSCELLTLPGARSNNLRVGLSGSAGGGQRGMKGRELRGAVVPARRGHSPQRSGTAAGTRGLSATPCALPAPAGATCRRLLRAATTPSPAHPGPAECRTLRRVAAAPHGASCHLRGPCTGARLRGAAAGGRRGGCHHRMD